MGLTSEHVHWMGGLAILVVAALSIAWNFGWIRGRWPRWLLPALLLGYAMQSFFDAQLHGSALPTRYVAETRQHWIQGALVAVAGITEMGRAAGRWKARESALVTPLALVGVGLVFWMHAQHDAQLDPMLLTLQHRAMAVSLWVAAAARAVAVWRDDERESVGWWWPLMVFALLLVIYTESASSGGHQSTGEAGHRMPRIASDGATPKN